MSALRRQMVEAVQKSVPRWPSPGWAETIDIVWPIIETELQKRDQEIDQLKSDLEDLRDNEANRLLEQTIEVLEGFLGDGPAQMWWRDQAKPLLDNLKAREK